MAGEAWSEYLSCRLRSGKFVLVLYTNTKVLFELIKSGLWGTGASLSNYGEIGYSSVMSLAEEQSVVGLVTVGLERVKDVKIPQEWSLQFIGSTLQIEQRNKAMIAFVGKRSIFRVGNQI